MPEPSLTEAASTMGQLFRETGGWGLSGVMTFALVWIAKSWREEARGRLDDQKEMGRALQANTLATSEQVTAIRNREEAFKESVKSQELAVVVDREIVAKLGEVRTELSALKIEQTRTREALIAKGVVAP